MTTKHVVLLLSVFFMAGLIPLTHGETDDNHENAHHKMMHSVSDERISLGLPDKMKQHQLANMRSHLEAIQSIIGLIAEGEFDNASKIANSKLGLTDEMKNMCNMFSNKEFRELGFAFHKSGNDLGETLLTKDVNKSLAALQTTIGYCTQCHATFRQ